MEETTEIAVAMMPPRRNDGRHDQNEEEEGAFVAGDGKESGFLEGGFGGELILGAKCKVLYKGYTDHPLYER